MHSHSAIRKRNNSTSISAGRIEGSKSVTSSFRAEQEATQHLAYGQVYKYKFALNRDYVGKLMLQTLKGIARENLAYIFCSQEPWNDVFVTFTVEGTIHNIALTLNKISGIFPPDKFPDVTLRRLTNIFLEPQEFFNSVDLNLQVYERGFCYGVISSFISAYHFFIVRPNQPYSGAFHSLCKTMKNLYSSGRVPRLVNPIKYKFCVVLQDHGCYRSQIVHVHNEGDFCVVLFLDFGGYYWVETKNICEISRDLLALPFFATECYLANLVSPPNGELWSEKARLFVEGLTFGKIIVVQCRGWSGNGIPLVNLYLCDDGGTFINKELVVRGFASACK